LDQLDTTVATTATFEHPVFTFVWNDCSALGTTNQTVPNFTSKSTVSSGKNYTVIVIGPVIQDIIASTELRITGRFLGRVVYNDNHYDVFSMLAATGTSCPIAAGTAALSFDVLLKPSWPSNVVF